jgi:hypothetical protein
MSGSQARPWNSRHNPALCVPCLVVAVYLIAVSGQRRCCFQFLVSSRQPLFLAERARISAATSTSPAARCCANPSRPEGLDFLDAGLQNMEPVYRVGPVLAFSSVAGVTALFPPPPGGPCCLPSQES